MKYNHKAVEEKWQKIWEDKGVFHASDDTEKEKFYALIEFPYKCRTGIGAKKYSTSYLDGGYVS